MASKRVTKQDKILDLKNRRLALLEKAVKKEENAEITDIPKFIPKS